MDTALTQLINSPAGTGLLAHYSSRPAVLVAILFLAPFVLEEAAILAAAGIATAGLLSPPAAFLPLLFGIVASDWFLFGLGHLAIRIPRIRQWIGNSRLEKGRELLGRGMLASAVTARLVPWLLPPIFIASGLLGVRFSAFALANGAVALVYTTVFFVLAFEFNSLLLERFSQWGWVGVAALAIGLLGFSFVRRRRASR